ncbi:MAG: phosphorylcholine phosphatase [Pyrinomonadaceae bacterium]|nr:phosphorylcholine phosphatase [Pyrinomonadaceae bacterium]
MEHELFRYLSPGITFIVPIYLAACWAVVNTERGESIRDFILLGGSATVPALAIPLGWWIYNCYRAFRHITTSSYEEKPFVRVIREGLKVIYDPARRSYYIDFTCINKDVGWRSFSERAFLIVFHPFVKGRRARLREQRKGKLSLGYLEPVSDLLLWPNPTYDYARSISSVRYGIDSSFFAFIFGLLIGLASLGLLSHYVPEPPFKVFTHAHVLIWYALLFVLITILITLSLLRRKQADREYSARLTLITIVSSETTRVDTATHDEDLPAALRQQLARLPTAAHCYAAFDLDNTLLVGDIGDALFAKLVQQGMVNEFGWKAYQKKIVENRKEAYVAVVEAMRGLPVATICEMTEKIISGQEPFVLIEGESVPAPRPNALMQSLVTALRLRGIEVFVVTASNQTAATIAAWNFFGIPSENVLGIRSGIYRNKLGQRLFDSVEHPVPVEHGKVEVLKGRLGSVRPCITAGDSEQDLPLLNYTHDDGIILWVDDSQATFSEMQQTTFRNRNAFFIERPS